MGAGVNKSDYYANNAREGACKECPLWSLRACGISATSTVCGATSAAASGLASWKMMGLRYWALETILGSG